MFSIYDGREEFYQWDIDRKIVVKDSTIQQVHFCNKTDDCSLVCEVYDLDGQRVADVPNILLTTDWRINVYGYTGDYTKHSECFKVNARTKPADYAYTETEVLNYAHLEEHINLLDENVKLLDEQFGSFVGDITSTYATAEYVNTEISMALDNYATKEEVEQLVAEGKAIMAVANDTQTISDVSSQEMYEAAQNGKAVYMQLWVDGIVLAQTIKADKVIFESSLRRSIVGADGNTYSAQGFRQYEVRGNKITGIYEVIPNQAYTDAMIAYEKPYELIQSFTTTEDTLTIQIDGAKLDNFALYVDVPISNYDGGLNLRVFNRVGEILFTGWITAAMSKTQNNVFGVFGRTEGGLMFIEYTNGAAKNTARNLYTLPQYISGNSPFDKILLFLGSTSSYRIPTGTKVELWGVKTDG